MTKGSQQLECNIIECDDNAVCLNKEGKLDCRCIDGYKGNGQTCEGEPFLILSHSLFKLL